MGHESALSTILIWKTTFRVFNRDVVVHFATAQTFLPIALVETLTTGLDAIGIHVEALDPDRKIGAETGAHFQQLLAFETGVAL